MCVSGAMMESSAYILQGISDNQQGKQQQRALEAEGRSAVMAGNDQAAGIRDEGRRIEGANRARLGSSGVDMGSASAQVITEENARASERDALLAIYGGQVTKHARDFEGKQARHAGKMSLINSGIKAYATIEKAAAKAASGGMG